PPAPFEVAQSFVVELASPKVELSIATPAGPVDRRPHHQVVATELPVAAIRGAELIDHIPVPGEDEGGGNRLALLGREHQKSQPLVDEVGPDALQEPSGLNRDPESPPCLQ